jgi:hypothetical protein
MSNEATCPTWCNYHQGELGGSSNLLDYFGEHQEVTSTQELGEHRQQYRIKGQHENGPQSGVAFTQRQDVEGRHLPELLFWHGQHGITNTPGEVPLTYRTMTRQEAFDLGRALLKAVEAWDEALPDLCECGDRMASGETHCFRCNVKEANGVRKARLKVVA